MREKPQGGVDVVLHFAGDGAALAALLNAGGRMASTLGLTSEQLGRDDVTLAPIMANPVTGTLAKLADAAAAGTMRVPIMRTYELEEVPSGLADFAARTLGKLAVQIPGLNAGDARAPARQTKRATRVRPGTFAGS